MSTTEPEQENTADIPLTTVYVDLHSHANSVRVVLERSLTTADRLGISRCLRRAGYLPVPRELTDVTLAATGNELPNVDLATRARSGHRALPAPDRASRILEAYRARR